MQHNTQKITTPGRRHTFSEQGGGTAFAHELLDLARVTRVVKGGRRFRFRASVVVGDRQGQVGFGMGKSRDVQQAIRKAEEQATKNIIRVPLHKGSIKHMVEARYNGSRVLLKPAKEGTGLIAGGTVRTIADLCGIKNLVSKSFGSSNKVNTVRAAMSALQSL